MKYVLVIGDGMADNPVPELGNKTPLEYARKPDIDAMSGSDFGIVTENGGYAVKFRVLELWGQIMEKIN